MRANGQLHAPAVLLPEVHTRIPRTGGLVGTGTLWTREKSLVYRDSNPGSSRPQLSHYADWATAAQHYSAHSIVAAHYKLNLWLLWRTIFTVLNRVQWFPSLKPLQKHLVGKRCATDADAKQAVMSWLQTPQISPPPRYRRWRHDGPNAVMSMVSMLRSGVYHLLHTCRVIMFWASRCYLMRHILVRTRVYTHIYCIYIHTYIVCMYIHIYRVSQEECARLRESVP